MRQFILALLAVILSGIAYYLSANFNAVWYFMWVAPIPLLLYAFHQVWWKTFIVSFIATLAIGLHQVVGYAATAIPLTGFVFSALLVSVELSLVYCLTGYLVLRRQRWVAVFYFPVLLSLMEYLTSLTAQGTFDTIAYGQFDFLPVLQIASITGYIGITFIVSLFAAAVAFLISFYKRKKATAVIAFVVSMILVFAGLIFGVCHKQYNDKSVYIKMGMVSVSRSPRSLSDLATRSISS